MISAGALWLVCCDADAAAETMRHGGAEIVTAALLAHSDGVYNDVNTGLNDDEWPKLESNDGDSTDGASRRSGDGGGHARTAHARTAHAATGRHRDAEVC